MPGNRIVAVEGGCQRAGDAGGGIGVAAQVHRLCHAFLVAVGVARAPERGAQGVQDVARRTDLVADCPRRTDLGFLLRNRSAID